MVLTVGNQEIETTEQGFLVNKDCWNEQVALAMAQIDHVELAAQHWEIIEYARDYYQRYKHLPNMRMFGKAITRELGPEKGNSRYLHQLFPDGPLKFAFKYAGLPKPPTCL